MDFIDEVRTRSGRFAKRIEHLESEEATKSALVMPFVQMLGYDIFDPTEVLPEFTADVGNKKGEKVDYALLQNGQPVIIIECKKYGNDLSTEQKSQLLRYFNITTVRFGVLTDGIVYQFFSDLDKENYMDPRPFFEFNMLDFTDAQVEELKRFTKAAFDTESIVGAARDLKYLREIKLVMNDELNAASPEFLDFIIRKVYVGKRVTKNVREVFSDLTHRALAQFVNERVNDRLQSALDKGEPQETTDTESVPDEDVEPEVLPLELEALYVIKSVVREVVDVARVDIRNAKSYCNIILYDGGSQNYWRIVLRLWLREDPLRMNLLDGREHVQLESLDGIYQYANDIRARIVEKVAANADT